MSDQERDERLFTELGEIKAKQDAMHEELTVIKGQVRRLENFKTRVMGWSAGAAAVAAVAWPKLASLFQ